MLDKLDSPGGHVAVCLSLFVLCAALQVAGYAWAHDCLMQAQGAVYLSIQIRRNQ